MLLMEEKTGIGSFRLSEQTLRTLHKRCVVARNLKKVHATVATKPQRSQRFFTTVPGPKRKITEFYVLRYLHFSKFRAGIKVELKL